MKRLNLNPHNHPPMRPYVAYSRLLGLFVLFLWFVVLLVGPAVWATLAPVDCGHNVCEVRR